MEQMNDRLPLAAARQLFVVLTLTTALVAGGTPQLLELIQLQGADSANGDWFGFSVAVKGDIVAVGSRSDDDACPADPGCDSGSVYIFSRNNGGPGSWNFLKKLTASDAAAGDWFGTGVALDGEILVVGAPGRDGVGVDSGAVYVFDRNLGGPDNWGERTIVTPTDSAVEHRFGGALTLSGGTLVAAAPWDDDACPADPECQSGAAYVFYRDQGGPDNWGEAKKLVASDAEENDRFGGPSLDEDVLIVGAAWNDDACPSDPECNSGSAYVFYRDQGGADNWGEVTKLTASDGAAGDVFGRGGAVAVSGHTVVVGALFGDGNEIDSGSAYVFERDLGGPDNWGEVTRLVASNGQAGDWFGEGVAISDDAITIGARSGDGAAVDSGAVYWYQRNEGGPDAWGETLLLTQSDGEDGDYFGADVSSDGTWVVAGARQDDEVGCSPSGPDCDSGSAYVFSVPVPVFADGFESGDTAAWSLTVPP